MIFDTHTHLDDEQFDDIRDTVLARAEQAGVDGMIVVGTSVATSRKCVELATAHDQLHAAVGIQPNYCNEADEEAWSAIVAMASQQPVVAIGETGLDRHWDYTPFDVQQDYFDRHLRLSQTSGLPFIVHMRDCDEDVLRMLREAAKRAPLHGVMHSFTGSAETAAECLSLGLHISFAGMVTYKKSRELRSIARTVPLDRLLVETDCPYLSPHPVRGQRPNEPALIAHTAACLADLHGMPVDELAQRTTENAHRLFRIR